MNLSVLLQKYQGGVKGRLQVPLLTYYTVGSLGVKWEKRPVRVESGYSKPLDWLPLQRVVTQSLLSAKDPVQAQLDGQGSISVGFERIRILRVAEVYPREACQFRAKI